MCGPNDEGGTQLMFICSLLMHALFLNELISLQSISGLSS